MVDGLVSVIVPAYNAERFIGEALDSTFAQDYGPIEAIVVDDGSTDRTAEIASRYDVQLIRQPNRGPSAARNAAMALACGEYIANLDADDIWPPDRLTELVTALERSGAGIAIGLTEFFVTPGEAAPPHFPHGVENPTPKHLTATLTRRSVYEAIGTYDESLRFAEDFDWMMRARDAGVKVTTVERVVNRYRVHASNTTRDYPGRQAAALRVLRMSVDRRRERGGR